MRIRPVAFMIDAPFGQRISPRCRAIWVHESNCWVRSSICSLDLSLTAHRQRHIIRAQLRFADAVFSEPNVHAMRGPRTPCDHASLMMELTGIWRYPVKSMRGESLHDAWLSSEGVFGDRVVQVFDGHGRLVTARTHSALLAHQEALGSDDEPTVDGHHLTTPEARSVIAEVVGSVRQINASCCLNDYAALRSQSRRRRQRPQSDFPRRRPLCRRRGHRRSRRSCRRLVRV